MDLTNLKAIKAAQVEKDLSIQRHNTLLQAQGQTQDTILSAATAIIKYLEGHTSKTQVVNQLKSINTPDALRVAEAVNSLHDTIKKQKETDLTEVTKILKDVLEQAKQIPKELPKEKEEKFVDYTDKFKSLEEVVKTVEKAVKAQKLEVKAPIVNVKEPDLKPIKQGLDDVKTAIDNKEIPKPESPFTSSKKEVKVELQDGALPTHQVNNLLTEKFDDYTLIYDDFGGKDTAPSATKYYYKRKLVATITYKYDSFGRYKGAKKT